MAFNQIKYKREGQTRLAIIQLYVNWAYIECQCLTEV